jgi:hypothetical protein
MANRIYRQDYETAQKSSHGLSYQAPLGSLSKIIMNFPAYLSNNRYPNISSMQSDNPPYLEKLWNDFYISQFYDYKITNPQESCINYLTVNGVQDNAGDPAYWSDVRLLTEINSETGIPSAFDEYNRRFNLNIPYKRYALQLLKTTFLYTEIPPTSDRGEEALFTLYNINNSNESLENFKTRVIASKSDSRYNEQFNINMGILSHEARVERRIEEKLQQQGFASVAAFVIGGAALQEVMPVAEAGAGAGLGDISGLYNAGAGAEVVAGAGAGAGAGISAATITGISSVAPFLSKIKSLFMPSEKEEPKAELKPTIIKPKLKYVSLFSHFILQT